MSSKENAKSAQQADADDDSENSNDESSANGYDYLLKMPLWNLTLEKVLCTIIPHCIFFENSVHHASAGCNRLLCHARDRSRSSKQSATASEPNLMSYLANPNWICGTLTLIHSYRPWTLSRLILQTKTSYLVAHINALDKLHHLLTLCVCKCMIILGGARRN
jgi:hypothetical protein